MKNTAYCGFSKICITPKHKVHLAGYEHRISEFDKICEDLFLRVLYIELNKKESDKKVIITADLIWWDNALVTELKYLLNKKYNLRTENIFFSATHSHSTPQIAKGLSPLLGKIDDRYIEYLRVKIFRAIQNAIDSKEKCYVKFSKTSCQLGINRRLKKDGQIKMAPNYDGVNDTTVKILEFFSSENDLLRGMLIHGICHANVSAENSVSPDFPGIAVSLIEKHHKNKITACYLQGFCGNIRPDFIDEDEFKQGVHDDALLYGKKLAESICKNSKRKTVNFKFSTELGYELRMRLPFKKLPTKKRLSELKKYQCTNRALKKWSSVLLKKKKYFKENIPNLLIHRLPICEEFILVGVNAEVVIEYHFKLKKYFGEAVIPVGYCDGIVGYIPTAKQINEGGYEAWDAYKYFILPFVFSEKIEEKFSSALKKLFYN
ncbi:MAG TPA: neutral/alkaline non-lysosomal ceramidase N-terminal domain-containing protein [Victivallales bacterium]|nr:neutral/alkaline non-lysosomal ceramidase N-terminal domain-containing protein [Victivallales bacterium]